MIFNGLFVVGKAMGINMDDENILLEPGTAYQTVYKNLFSKNANEYFDKLVSESKINVDENIKTSDNYRILCQKINEIEKKLKSQKTAKALLITLGIVAIATSVITIVYAYYGATAVSAIVAIASFLISQLVVKKKIALIQAELSDAKQKADAAYQYALSLISPFLDMLDSDVTRRLVQMTVPTLNIDKNYDMRRFDYLSGKYGYSEQDGGDTSTVGIMSGEIVGNPFIFQRRLSQTWTSETYTGSLLIEWTEYSVNSEGKRVRVHRSEVLHASVVKPMPYFYYLNSLIYGNEAAPNLSFSREKTHFERLSEKKQKSFIKSKTKQIQKQTKKDVSKGFTSLGNEEFDSVFGATNRDNEVEFRLLFTPLAQKNILSLIKETSPYGDDFDIYKNRCINELVSEHLQNWNFNIDSSQYSFYDIQMCKDAFIRLNEDYFQSVYFDFAPLLSIPLYQQHKPHEYIYKNSYSRNYTVREAEVLVNRLSEQGLIDENARTPAILKTQLKYTENDADYISVTSHAYKTIQRVDYVPVYGGDGRYHDVPVEWYEYIPVEKTSTVRLQELKLSDRQFRHSEYSQTQSPYTFYHSIFARVM